jgi:hypothetical protein
MAMKHCPNRAGACSTLTGVVEQMRRVREAIAAVQCWLRPPTLIEKRSKPVSQTRWSEIGLGGGAVAESVKPFKAGGYRDEERWPEIHAQMIDAMIRLEQAI